MATAMIRVSESTRDRFTKLAHATGRSISQLVEEAVEAMERRLFFDRLTNRYDELRADANAWSEIEDERASTGL